MKKLNLIDISTTTKIIEAETDEDESDNDLENQSSPPIRMAYNDNIYKSKTLGSVENVIIPILAN